MTNSSRVNSLTRLIYFQILTDINVYNILKDCSYLKIIVQVFDNLLKWTDIIRA